MRQRTLFAVLFPLLAVLIIATYAGGLGVLFMVVFGDPHAEESIGEWIVVALGMIITVTVPIVAYRLQQRFEKS